MEPGAKDLLVGFLPYVRDKVAFFYSIPVNRNVVIVQESFSLRNISGGITGIDN